MIRVLRILFISAVFGIILGMFIGSYLGSDLRIPWQAIGSPPGNASNVVRNYEGTFVKAFTRSNDESVSYVYEFCGVGCWKKVDSNSAYYEKEFDCDGPTQLNLPTLEGLEKGFFFCEPWGPGMIYRVYAISREGDVYAWEKRVGEWDFFAAFIYPFVGLLFSISISIVWILISSYSNLLSRISSMANHGELRSRK